MRVANAMLEHEGYSQKRRGGAAAPRRVPRGSLVDEAWLEPGQVVGGHPEKDELVALRLRSSHSSDDAPTFASNRGTPLLHRNVPRCGFEPARDLAGLLASLTFHDLRHATASRLSRAGLG